MSAANPTSQGLMGAGLGQPELCEFGTSVPPLPVTAASCPVGLKFEGSAGAVGILANKAEPRVAFLGHSVSGPVDSHELMTWPLYGEWCLVLLPRRWLPLRWFGLPQFPPEGGVGCTSAFRYPHLAAGNSRQKPSR